MSSDSEKEGSYFQLKTPVVEELRLIHQDKMSQVAMDCLLAAFLNSLLAFLIFWGPYEDFSYQSRHKILCICIQMDMLFICYYTSLQGSATQIKI